MEYGFGAHDTMNPHNSISNCSGTIVAVSWTLSHSDSGVAKPLQKSCTQSQIKKPFCYRVFVILIDPFLRTL